MMAYTALTQPSCTSVPAQGPVLVLDDDRDLAKLIDTALTRDGWTTVIAHTLAEGRTRLALDRPRIIVVDLGLPDGNGIAFVREVAARGDTGILVVSGRSDEVDRVVGLEVGADDYLTKPFSLREMVARVRALSRRLDVRLPMVPALPAMAPTLAPIGAAMLAPPELMTPVVAKPVSWAIGGIQAQPARLRLLAADGSETRLTGGEAGLLEFLLVSPDNLAARDAISERVLGRRLQPEQRGVDQLASCLRQKLLAASEGRVTISALRGKGYRLVW